MESVKIYYNFLIENCINLNTHNTCENAIHDLKFIHTHIFELKNLTSCIENSSQKDQLIKNMHSN